MDDYANRLDTDGRDYVFTDSAPVASIMNILLIPAGVVEYDEADGPRQVRLSALVQTVALRLNSADPDRAVDWVIAED